MKKSKKGGRRVTSYAEAARGNQASSSAAGTTPSLQPPVAKGVSSPAPSRSRVEAPSSNQGEQTIRPPDSRGPALEIISGVSSEHPQEITKGKSSTGKEPAKDTHSKTQTPNPIPLSFEPKEARRTFSYAEAARRGQKSNTPSHPDLASSTEYPAMPSSGAEKIKSAGPSAEVASPAPLPVSLPPDKKPNKGKGKEKQQAAEIQATGSRLPAITPAVPAIDFGSPATASGSKKKKKNKKGNKAQPPQPSTSSTLPAVDLARPEAPRAAQAATSSATVSLESASAAPRPAQVRRAKRNKNANKKGKKPASAQPQPTPPQQVVKPPTPILQPPSTNLPPSYYDIDAMVEARIQEAIAFEEARKYQFEQRQLRIKTAIAAHDKKESKLSLWESQYEWDLRILWRSQDGSEAYQWNVHHDILCRESPYFKDRLPPKDPGGGYVSFNCSSHSKEQLATVLKWMYDKTYDGSRINWDNGVGKGRNVPNGEPVRRNVFMYICGASVNCESLMAYASDRIDEVSEAILDNNLFTLEFCSTNDLFKFSLPLSLALMMMYEQGHRQNMLMLRLAMARLCDVVLFKMLCNEGFNRTVNQEWGPRFLWHNVVNDNIFFGFHNVLFPMEGPDDADKLLAAARSHMAAMAQASSHRAVPTIHSVPIAKFTADDSLAVGQLAQANNVATQGHHAVSESSQKTEDGSHRPSSTGDSAMTTKTFAQGRPVIVHSSHATTALLQNTTITSQSSQPTEAFFGTTHFTGTGKSAQLAPTSQAPMPSQSGTGFGTSEQSVSETSHRDVKAKKPSNCDRNEKGKVKTQETESDLSRQLSQMDVNESPRRRSSASSHTIGRFDLRGGSEGGSESSYTRSGNIGELDTNEELGNSPERRKPHRGHFNSQDARQAVGYTLENRRSGRDNAGRADMYKRSREFRQHPPAPAGNFVDYSIPSGFQHGHSQHPVNQFGRHQSYERRYSVSTSSDVRNQYYHAGFSGQVHGPAHYGSGYGFGQPDNRPWVQYQGPSGFYDNRGRRSADNFAVSESGRSTGSEAYPYPPYWEARQQMDRAAIHAAKRRRIDPARVGPGFHPQGPPQVVYTPTTSTAPGKFHHMLLSCIQSSSIHSY